MRAITALGRLLASLLTRLVKLVILLGLLGGIPAGLTTQIGWPLPRSVPDRVWLEHAITAPITDTVVLNLLAIVLWILWAALTLSVLAEAGAAIAGTTVPRIPLLAPVQPLAGWLVAGLTASVLASVTPVSAGTPPVPAAVAATSVTAYAPASAAVTTHYGVSSPPAATVHTGRPPVTTAAVTRNPELRLLVAGQEHTCTVRRGDNLSHLAEAWLGDANRWPEIYHLNKGRHFRVGGTLADPNLIYPGWTLTLPDDARPPGPPASAQPPAPATPAPPPAEPSPATPPTPSAPATAHPAPALPVPPAPASPATPGATTAPSPPTAGQHDPAPAHRDHEQPGVELPGGWIPISLAASLLAAAAMVWLRRRHRFIPRPAAVTTPLEDLRPLPPVITQLRRGVRRHAPDLLPADPDAPAEPRRPHGAADTDGRATGANTGATAETEQPRVPAAVLPPVGPSGPELAGLTDPVPTGGLGLTGPGADAAARAFLVATLSSGSPQDPDARGQVVIPAGALTTLLGAGAVQLGGIPRLTITADLSDALTRTEELLIDRRRLLQDEDADDLDDLRAANPYYPPMPPVLLIAEVPAAELRARLTTTLHLGVPLQINAVLLGDWPRGDTLTVAPDGRTTHALTAENGATGSRATTGSRDRLAVLDTATAMALLEVLREAHTGEPATHAATSGASEAPPAEPDAAPEPPATARADNAGEPARAAEGAESPAPPAQQPGPPVPGNGARQDPQPEQAPRHGMQSRQRVEVRVLGEPAILEDGVPAPGLRTKAQELLVYLAVHRTGSDLSDVK
ncbi:MAG: hypothetical protein QOJ50_1807, partial [Cryptosporangiaceae bacterium]|nr:hypothetical protein [Cryptosporangiaceae bacterium]